MWIKVIGRMIERNKVKKTFTSIVCNEMGNRK